MGEVAGPLPFPAIVAPMTATSSPRTTRRVRPVAMTGIVLGISLVTAGWLTPHVFSEQEPVALNLQSHTFTLTDPAATIGPVWPAAGGEAQTVPVHRQFNLELGLPADASQASAKVGVSMYRGGETGGSDVEGLLSAEVWSFTVDRLDGAVLGPARVADTPATPPTTVEQVGQWVKFPRDVEQRSYPFFDSMLRASFPAEFQGTVMVDAAPDTQSDAAGEQAELYVFEQRIADERVADYRELVWDGSALGEQAELRYSVTRTIEVEPRSGNIVSLSEDLDAFFVNAAGDRVEDFLVFAGSTEEESERAMLAQALALTKSGLPARVGLGLMIAGAIVALASAVVLLLSRRRGGQR